MKITIPYAYTAEIIPPRCRLPRRVRQESAVTLTIHEVSSRKAPIAIKEHDPYPEFRNDGHPATIIYRWWRNRLYVRHRFQRASGAVWVTQTAADFLKDPYPYRLENAAGQWENEGYQSQAERRKDFRCWARSILFIDGERWAEAGEPRYVIMTFGLGHNHGLGWGTSLSTDDSYNSNISRDRYYRIDHYREAVKAATQIAQRRGDTKALPIANQKPTRFEIIIPQAIRLNPRREHGKGCEFINKCEAMIEASPTAGSAGPLLMTALQAT
jgi:hypothetical protein